MIIDIPPHIEQVIITTAKSEQLSVSELITKWATEKQAQTNPMIEAVMALEPSECFKNVDAVALQREWRDEWR